jgi:uncharacterized RDD family membrane protein YckC
VSDLVTGEAVVLELRLARLPSRALALGLDLALQLVTLLAVSILAAPLATLVDDAAVAALELVLIVAIVVGYPVAFETLTRGRTLGKLALGLRVVRDDGGPVRFRQALLRGLAAFFVDVWLTFGAGALISSLVSSRGKRLGDVIAGTVVVRERVPVHGGPVAAMPPPLAGWAAQLELSRMPDDLALAARQFLSRAHELVPPVRAAMAEELAAATAARVAPPPPPGTPAEPFLAAVLAERRRREAARLGVAMPMAPPTWHPAPAAGPPRPARPPDSASAGDGGFAPPG